MRYFLSSVMMATMFLLYACGTDDGGWNREFGDSGFDGVKVVKSQGVFYDKMLKSEFENVYLTAVNYPEYTSQKIYINFNGAELKKGSGLGESTLICSDRASVSKSGFDKTQKTKIINELKQYFAGSKPALEFISSMSNLSGTDHSVVHVGGTYKELGCTDSQFLYGAGYSDYGNLNRNDTAFVFSGANMKQEHLIEVTKQIITNMVGFTEGDFNVSAIPVVDQNSVKGKEQIRSMANLVLKLGDSESFDISSLREELKSILPEGSEVPVGFDRIITATVGASQKSSGWFGDIGNGGILSSIAGLFGSELLDSTTIMAVSTLMGVPELGTVAVVLGKFLANIDTSTTDKSTDSKSKIPDYGALLGIDTINNMPDLIANLRAHIDYVNQNHDANVIEAIRAMLIVGYSQQYRKITS